MLFFIHTAVTAEFWIGVVFGIVVGKYVLAILKWAWNLIPGVPKF